MDVIDENLRNTYFYDLWLKLGTCLEGLFETYGEWNGIEQLKALADIVLSTWNVLGIFPKESENGLFIDVR